MKNHVVLGVDDDPRNRRILHEIFDDNYNFVAVCDGPEALAAMEETEPDVILLDMMLPGLDGLEVCRRIRKHPSGRKAKILAISARNQLSDRLAGYEAGVDDYLAKPFAPEELRAKVEVFLRISELEEQLRQFAQILENQLASRTEQLLARERVSFLGMNVAQIVHNMNNPLSVLVGNVDVLLRTHGDDARFQHMRSALTRLQETVRSILDVVRTNDPEDEQWVNLSQVLSEELQLLDARTMFKYDVQKHISILGTPKIMGVSSHFHQILGNLLNNALDAMHTTRQKKLEITIESEEDVVTIQVLDTGTGISAENLEKIFDPFFTTKPAHTKGDEPTGTGLGLASVQQMVRNYHGEIAVKSAIGNGTLFILKFPANRHSPGGHSALDLPSGQLA